MNFKITPKTTQKIHSFNCQKYSTTSTLFTSKLKEETTKNSSKIKDNFKNFEEYFNNSILERNKFENYLKNELSKKRKQYQKGQKLLSHEKIKKKSVYIDKVESEGDCSDKELKNQERVSHVSVSSQEKPKETKNSTITSKPINIEIWSNESFPIKSNYMNPILNIMSLVSTEFAKLKYFFNKDDVPFSFPLKISFPLGLSFSATLNIDTYSMSHPPLSMFEVSGCSTSDFLSKNHCIEDNFNNSFYEKYFLEKQMQRNESDLDRESELGNLVYVNSYRKG